MPDGAQPIVHELKVNSAGCYILLMTAACESRKRFPDIWVHHIFFAELYNNLQNLQAREVIILESKQGPG